MKYVSAVSVLAALSILYALLRRRFYSRYPLQPNVVVLITGGSGGMGRALALYFAEAHCAVVVTGRNESALQRVAEECKTAGASSSHYIVADITTPSGTSFVAEQIHLIYPNMPVKYLVLNAGTGAIVPFSTESSYHDICHEMMEINYFPNVRFAQLFLPELSQTHSSSNPSRIIVMSSLAGLLPSIQRAPYTAAKHALQGFMTALRGETDVKITLCCPDYIDTEFHKRVRTNAATQMNSNHKRGITAMECARNCINGALCNKLEVMPLQG